MKNYKWAVKLWRLPNNDHHKHEKHTKRSTKTIASISTLNPLNFCIRYKIRLLFHKWSSYEVQQKKLWRIWILAPKSIPISLKSQHFCRENSNNWKPKNYLWRFKWDILGDFPTTVAVQRSGEKEKSFCAVHCFRHWFPTSRVVVCSKHIYQDE